MPENPTSLLALYYYTSHKRSKNLGFDTFGKKMADFLLPSPGKIVLAIAHCCRGLVKYSNSASPFPVRIDIVLSFLS